MSGSVHRLCWSVASWDLPLQVPCCAPVLWQPGFCCVRCSQLLHCRVCAAGSPPFVPSAAAADGAVPEALLSSSHIYPAQQSWPDQMSGGKPHSRVVQHVGRSASYLLLLNCCKQIVQLCHFCFVLLCCSLLSHLLLVNRAGLHFERRRWDLPQHHRKFKDIALQTEVAGKTVLFGSGRTAGARADL